MDLHRNKTFDEGGLYHIYEVPFDIGIRQVLILGEPYIDTFTSQTGIDFFDIKLPVSDGNFNGFMGREKTDDEELDYIDWYCEVSIPQEDLDKVADEYHINEYIQIKTYLDGKGRKRAKVYFDK